jgi:hypothetical protein
VRDVTANATHQAQAIASAGGLKGFKRLATLGEFAEVAIECAYLSALVGRRARGG